MPKRICDLFDKYRDGETSADERVQFEAHLANCGDCRARTSLLNNLVSLIRADEVRPRDIADRVAREAFRRAHSWDYEVISWLRPAPAVAALALVLVLLSSFWMISSNQKISAYSEYRALMEDADSINTDTHEQAGSDNELVIWLEQEGTSSD
jgi:anti-sigma factor RsiW